MYTSSVHVVLILCFTFVVHAVNRPPHIHTQPTNRDVFFKPRESVDIPCVASGIPAPVYRWKRNGYPFYPYGTDDRVVQLTGNGTLVFNNPEGKDEGIYQCFADNGYGVSASAKINLREAKLSLFVYEERQIHTADAGDTLTLNCVPPVSYPPADVSWIIKHPDNQRTAAHFDKRVSMDLEGRLHFANVLKADEQNGSAYACVAANYFMRDTAIGPEHVVHVLGTTAQKRPASELWTSPADQVFLKGGTLRLKCIFGGNPTPNVYWMKTDGVLPARATLKSFGQELMIPDLQMSDAGTYVCEGNNSVSSQSANKGFYIRIESGPYWINEPKPEDKSVGETATFVCEAGGHPQPYNSWFINGVAIEDVKDPRIYKSPRVQRPNSNHLIISHLTLEDHMVIQCNATSRHGYIWSDVSLNVIPGSVVVG